MMLLFTKAKTMKFANIVLKYILNIKLMTSSHTT